MASSVNATVKEILSKQPEMPTDKVIALVKERGLDAEESAIRNAVYNNRSAMKKQEAKPTPVSPPQGEFARLSVVNAVVTACGPELAKKLVEAVRVCGGIDEFSKVLDVIMEIKGQPK